MTSQEESVSSRRVVLLVNLGSPDSPSVGDVRRYLREFLMDERVLDVPWLLRTFIVNVIVAPFRAKKSAEAYRLIWTDDGSPLVVNSRKTEARLRAQIDLPVALAMGYQNPSIAAGVSALLDRKGGPLDEVLLIPMFPHYAMSTYETVIVAVRDELARKQSPPRLQVLAPFYNDPRYIEALAECSKPYLDAEYDHLLFSYHGLPLRHIRKTDPTGTHCLSSPDCCSTASPAHATCYRAQCFATTETFVAKTGVPRSKYSVAFQSRFGKDTWLEPFADAEIVRLATEGIRRLVVICPAFTADCLETLEEIGERGRESFLEAGGEEFRLIPCLNDHPLWIDALAHWSRTDPGSPPDSVMP